MNDLKTRFGNKCIEFKNQKSEIESLKKDKKSLSVTLKASKQELRKRGKWRLLKKRLENLKLLKQTNLQNKGRKK